MKTKRLLFISCLAAGALIASPSFGKPAKKSKAKRVVPQTTQVTRHDRHSQNISARTGSTRFAGRQYAGARYYSGTRYYGNYYGGGTRYYYGGYPYGGYSYYGGYPYGGYSYYGGYPDRGYNNYYSYYTPTYGYNASMVAAVQRRLGQLGYYHGVVDGVIGPQTRSAIAAFEDRNGLAVDGTISRPLLDTLGLA